MGKKRKFNKFAQRKRENKLGVRGNYTNTKPSYEDIVKENKEFDKYYTTQKICPEDEWQLFSQSIRQSLPTAFRITGSRSEAKALLEIVQGQFFKDCLNSENVQPNSVGELKPFCLPWFPEKLAWQLQLTRKDIRRSETYFRLHNFLISETSSGNINRQEAVSMIPPIVLDVKSHHKVLDMCAAPGSKTAQLIEMLHSSVDDAKNSPSSLPSGFVVANDVDNNRCYMLVHQAKRLNSPCILITNHDSAVMPNMTITEEDGVKGILKYDRILCDVPCSGDGTLRKSPDIWLKWNAANGNNLHGIQSRIVRRGAELLKVGGQLVYSTCSLNPIENEAVIHRLLVETEGAMKLLDPRSKLPGLKSSPGMEDWCPASKDLTFYDSFEKVPEQWHTVIRPQMFPPKPEDRDKFDLKKCMRVLPHQQDTGAFFIALLEKVNRLPWEAGVENNGNADSNKEKSDNKESCTSTPWGPQRKKRRIQGYREDPFVFFKDENEDVWPSIKSFYSISSDLKPECLLTRCLVGKKKNVYFCSSAVRDLVLNNENVLKIINTGVKTFVRCDNKNMKCAFRLAQEGLHSIFPFIGEKRKVSVQKDDLIMMLLNDNPQTPPEVITMSESTQEQVKNIETGSCVLMYSDPGTSLTLNLVGWKGTRSLRAYVSQPEAIHMLRLLGADVSKFDVNKFKKETEELDNVSISDDTKKEEAVGAEGGEVNH